MKQRVQRGSNSSISLNRSAPKSEVLTAVPPGNPPVSSEEIRTEFDRIVQSRGFRRSPRQCQMLRFLMERYLAGNGERVSEAEIGVSVFKKRPGYDASGDRTVAVPGLRLRRALAAYYRLEGRDDPVRFALPGRGYGLHVERMVPHLGMQAAQATVLGPAAGYRIEVSTLVVLDAQGHELFRRQFETPLDPGAYTGLYRNRRAAFADIDGDGRTETLFVEWPINIGEVGARLFCFSDTGALKWPPFIPGQQVSTDRKEYVPPFFISNVQPIPIGAKRQVRILVSSNHHLHSPNQIAMLDPKSGALISQYWHAGHLLAITHADLDNDGYEEVLAAGVNNGYRQATLIVFDPRDIRGASTQAGRRWLGLPWGSERAIVLFPRTCLAANEQYNRVVDLRLIPPRRILTVVSESVKEDGEYGQILYQLDYQLKVLSAAPDSHFLNRHREQELKLGHSWSEAEAEQLMKQVKVHRPSQFRFR